MEKRKEMLIQLFSDKCYKPMKFRELAGFLNVPKEDRDEFKHILDLLMSEGKVTINDTGRYMLCGRDILVGTFMGTQRGFGFVSIEGEKEDIFIGPTRVNGALNKDKVQVKIIKEVPGKKREGEVIKIIEHGNDLVVGTFNRSKNFGFVIPDDVKFGKDIYIPHNNSKGAVNGHKVLVKITEYGDEKKNPEGKIVQVIGHINDPGVDIMSIVLAFGIPNEFSEELMKEVATIPEEVLPEEYAGRKDIRNLTTVTIDGEDAKDLDDAITISKEGDNYKLGVHIADVTHYVREGSLLDKEALKRATSVYLVDRVIPQLPHRLSNGICSLNQGVDRLALSCFMTINDKGDIIDHEICETVINVDRRMSYTNVKKILEDRDEEVIAEYKELVPMFEIMEQAAIVLRKRRRKRGAIDFDFPETKIILDEKGKPVEIRPYERNTATRIIEDFMLAANETIAQDYFWRESPFVYRIHEAPDQEKIIKLGIFINNFGYAIKGASEEIHPKEIQSLLDKIAGSEEEMLISRLTLRSMKQAKYSVRNEGHFGLASQYYCHFTSPIRRYPDLQIHRIIKESLHGGLSEKRVKHYNSILPEVSQVSSLCERRADEAEREVIKLKKVEYIRKYIGKTFEGVISSVTSSGVYVELPNTIEGMIRISDFKDDYYYFEEENYRLVGEVLKKEYKLGQKIKVMVAAADKVTRTIDFEPVETE